MRDHLFQQLDAVHLRHLEVEKNDVGMFLEEDRQTLFRITGCENLQVLLVQGSFDESEILDLVVNDQQLECRRNRVISHTARSTCRGIGSRHLPLLGVYKKTDTKGGYRRGLFRKRNKEIANGLTISRKSVCGNSVLHPVA